MVNHKLSLEALRVFLAPIALASCLLATLTLRGLNKCQLDVFLLCSEEERIEQF